MEVRSLNNRFLEMNVRLPHGLAGQEIPLRNAIKARFARGRFDVYVNVREERLSSVLDTARAKEVYEALDGLRKDLLIAGPVGMGDLLRMKDFFISEEGQYDTGSLREAFNEALSEVEKMRLREGRMIKEDVLGRADLLEKIHAEIKALVPGMVSSVREKFAGKLKALVGEAGYDDSRVLQEASIMAEKADIAEELTRIEGYIGQIRKVLEKGGKIGRELDFILQELHREVNTISSKSEDMELLNKSILFRAEVERIRQQIQNLQ